MSGYKIGLISVIMPCFNSEKYLREAIDSVLEQSYTDFELIVVDDSSTDRSFEILREMQKAHPSKITVLKQPHKGPFPARNLALKHARGEYVTFLDADDYWHKDFLNKLHAVIADSGSDIAYCGWQRVDGDKIIAKPYIPPKYEGNGIIVSFLKGCPFTVHTVLIKHSIIDVLGGFSERYAASMDYDLWLRLITITTKMVLVPEVLAFYRWHDNGQISAEIGKQMLNAWKIRRDFIRCNAGLASHLDKKELRKLLHGTLLTYGYSAFWKRDLASAHLLFRKAFFIGFWDIKDLRYVLPSLLPLGVYCFLINFVDKIRRSTDRGRQI